MAACRLLVVGVPLVVLLARSEVIAEFQDSVDLRVRSGSFSAGNLAEFYIRGSQLFVPVGRGLNVVALSPDGKFQASKVFDTHAADSEAFVSFAGGLPLGTPVLVAIMDEAIGNLTEAGKAALASLGAAEVALLEYRCSYALIGVKGQPALAELVLTTNQGVAEVSAVYVPSSYATTLEPVTTTSSTLEGLVALRVRSGGFSDGILAEFFLGGRQLFVPGGRGLNVVVLSPEGTFQTSEVFDTHAGDSDAFVAFANRLAPGTPVLVAVMDEAVGNLTDGAKAALTSLGARQVSSLWYRCSYALIGVKGRSALAELVRPSSQGVAEVSAVYIPASMTTAQPGAGTTPEGSLELRVRSGGFNDGKLAEFYVGGRQLSVPVGRGLNVVVLSRTGTLQTSQVFDTHASDSEAFVAFANSWALGTPILVAIMDEAISNLTEAGKAALVSLGAQQVPSLWYRCSYALIAMKGQPALAELVRPSSQGAAEVSAMFMPATTSTTPTTTEATTTTTEATTTTTEATPTTTEATTITTEATTITTEATTTTVEATTTATATITTTEATTTTTEATTIATEATTTTTETTTITTEATATTTTTTTEAATTTMKATTTTAEATTTTTEATTTTMEATTTVTVVTTTTTKAMTTTAETATTSATATATTAAATTTASTTAITINTTTAAATITASTTATTITTTATATASTTAITITTTTTTTSATTTTSSSRAISITTTASRTTTTAAPCTSTTSSQVPGRRLVLTVRSAGFFDGNFAAFSVNGRDLGVAVGRGLNVVVLRPEGPVNTSRIFDTFGSGAESLQVFLAGLLPGTPVMISAMDEAATNLTAGARAAIETLGVRKIRQLSWRGSYAFIGIKNGAALAEKVLPPFFGVAVASATLEAVPPSPLPDALCAGRSAAPPVAGWMLDGQLRLDAGCRYPVWEGRSAGQCLDGSWVIIAGGSNTILMAIGLSDLLAKTAILPLRDGASMGGSTLVDVIVQDGAVLYRNSKLLAQCVDMSRPYGTDCKNAIARQIAAAPTYNGRGTRITLFTSQYWDHAETGVDVLMSDKGWAAAKAAVLVQISTWYIYCSVKQVPWCTRPSLMTKPGNASLRAFAQDMNSTLTKLSAICRPGGRAGELGCVVGTTSWQNPSPGYETDWYLRYNNAITSAVKPISSDLLRLVDFWTLGQAMPEEEYLGHASPVAILWNWQVMLSGMCSARMAAPARLVRFTGPACFAAKASWEQCPDYRDNCRNTFRCELWECMSSVPCTLTSVPENATSDVVMTQSPTRPSPTTPLSTAVPSSTPKRKGQDSEDEKEEKEEENEERRPVPQILLP